MLKQLPVPNLHATFMHAYSLLTQLVAQIEWDELLSMWSMMFIIEEEYHMQKAQVDISAHGRRP